MERKYTIWAVTAFIILSAFGVTLRLMALYPIPHLNYIFILHAHSHFAFAGWIFLALMLLIFGQLPEAGITQKKRVAIFLTMISAAGMLVSFSIEGYKAVSIIFSTLFIFAGYYLSYLVLKSRGLRSAFNPDALVLLKASLLFLCLSSLGPFALGPLIAAGFKNAPFYNDAIYFYLHFQMNGWMLPAALAIYINGSRTSDDGNKREKTFWMKTFVWSTIPLFFIFTLWNGVSAPVRMITISGALLNLISWIKVLPAFINRRTTFPLPARAALLAITCKVVFQTLICFPQIGTWVFSQRNVIIGYIHLLTLGAISPLILHAFFETGFLKGKGAGRMQGSFLLTVAIYILLLFLQPFLSLFSVSMPFYRETLAAVSVLFLFWSILLLRYAGTRA